MKSHIQADAACLEQTPAPFAVTRKVWTSSGKHINFVWELRGDTHKLTHTGEPKYENSHGEKVENFKNLNTEGVLEDVNCSRTLVILWAS